MSDLAKRAVACKDWKWLPGAVDTDDNRVLTTRIDGVYDFYDFYDDCIHAGDWARNFWRLPARLPDFDDAATRGCLMAILNEAWGFNVGIEPVYSGRCVLLFWAARGGVGLIGIEADTLLECAVMALESAPEQP